MKFSLYSNHSDDNPSNIFDYSGDSHNDAFKMKLNQILSFENLITI